MADDGGQGLYIHPVLQGYGSEGMPLWHNKGKSKNPCVARSWRFVLVLFPPNPLQKIGVTREAKKRGVTLRTKTVYSIQPGPHSVPAGCFLPAGDRTVSFAAGLVPGTAQADRRGLVRAPRASD